MDQSNLKNFRTRLFDLQSRLVPAVTHIEEAVVEDIVAPGDPSTVPTHPADMDAEGVDTDVALAQNEEGILEAVQAALERIDKGQFGYCENCGREISAERLEAIPYTPFCIECAKARDSSRTT